MTTKEHMKEYFKEYRQRPEVKEHIREYMRKYNQRPEVKEHMKEYRKEYNQRPEVKEHMKEYRKEHNQRPEVKEHTREYILQYHRQHPRHSIDYTADDVVKLLRENNNILPINSIKKLGNGGHSLNCLKKSGVIRIEGDNIILTDSPMRAAFDGYYFENINQNE